MRSSTVGWTALLALFLTLAATGACYADGSLCDDGNACNGLETYDATAGTCIAGTPLDCDDGNPCTDDICVPGFGCQHAGNASPCDDGNACTVSDRCDGNGACIGTPVDCNDGSFCNGSEVCDPATGACVAGAPPSCTDADPCTLDACDAVTNTCVHVRPPNYEACLRAELFGGLWGLFRVLLQIQDTISGVPPRALGGRVLALRMTHLVADAIAALQGLVGDPVMCRLRGCDSPSRFQRRLRRAERDLQAFCALVGTGRLDPTVGRTLAAACLIVEPCHCIGEFRPCPLDIACPVGR